MRVFLDTNVLLEYLCGRSKAGVVRDFLDCIEDNGDKAFMSSSSYCTISYYVEQSFKAKGIHKPEKTERTREVLNAVLDVATIADVNHQGAIIATNDLAFSDFEDSMQYQCALNCNCDVLVTFNVKDFKNADQGNVQVMTPEQYFKAKEELKNKNKNK